MQQLNRQSLLVALGLLLALVPSAGCGDGETSTNSDLSTGGADGPAPGDGMTAPDMAQPTPAIIVAERVFMPNGRSYYLSVLSSMPTGPIDRTKAREFTSADVEIYNGKVFVRDRVANTMTRFSVSDSLQLVQEAQFSFQNSGLPSNRAYSAYLSPTLAFALDSAGLQMVGWDPTGMKLTGDKVSLSFLEKDGLPDVSLGVPTRVGDKVIVPVGWDDGDNLLTNPGIGAALILDSNMKAAPAVIEDAHVGGGYVVFSFGGDAWVGGTVGGDVRLFGGVPGGGTIPGSGVVRIKSGTSVFDGASAVDVNAITKSVGVWGMHMLDATHVLAQILDPDLSTDTIKTPDDYYGSSSFFYVMVDTTTKTFTRQDAIPAGGIGNAQEHVVDGVLYVQVSGDTGSEVHPVTVSGIGPKAFDVPSGDLWFARRLR